MLRELLVYWWQDAHLDSPAGSRPTSGITRKQWGRRMGKGLLGGDGAR